MLGHIVAWRVPSLVGIEKIKASLDEAGLSIELAKDMRVTTAFNRALKDMSKGRVIEKLQRDGVNVRFQLTRKAIDSSRGVIDYNYETTVTLNTCTGDLDCQVDSIRERAKELLQQKMSERITNDISRLIQKIFDDMGGDLIPIRPSGGAYFVPHHHDDTVRKTKKFLSLIGGELRMFEAKMGSSDTNQAVINSMNDYFQRMIDDLNEKIKGMNETPRRDAVSNRLKVINRVRAKIAVYANLLESKAFELKVRVEESAKKLQEKLGFPRDLEEGVVDEKEIDSESCNESVQKV